MKPPNKTIALTITIVLQTDDPGNLPGLLLKMANNAKMAMVDASKKRRFLETSNTAHSPLASPQKIGQTNRKINKKALIRVQVLKSHEQRNEGVTENIFTI